MAFFVALEPEGNYQTINPAEDFNRRIRALRMHRF